MALGSIADVVTEPFSGSYDPTDVTFLLKPCEIVATPLEEKERLIQSGARHYSEMLSAERLPDERYMSLYREALHRNAGRLRMDVAALARSIADRPETRRECVLISLARAGTPIGVLLKRALERLGVIAHHYSISIIRDRGIDRNALAFVASRHGAAAALFVDGWTGKGTIKAELVRFLQGDSLGFSPFLAVVADPAGRADLAATAEDYLIPSGLLNGIVSGLISRSVLRDDLVGPGDFHACLYQSEHADWDLSRAFISAIEAAAPSNAATSGRWTPEVAAVSRTSSTEMTRDLMRQTGVGDVNRIKPGIAEATRAMLRRVPDQLFVRDRGDSEVRHLLHLASQSGVPVQERDLQCYRAVTVIKSLGESQE
ncbi:cysteine protease StiP family protein [Sphingomonas sp. R86521]|uniref:cysteine protease StiP family protein n=1 Tax=Sphingomonas sp. R86521 TaxID=3093860 RepID=UPI0036D30E16